eukprot:2940092-Karenia_brevis.AAC.1
MHRCTYAWGVGAGRRTSRTTARTIYIQTLTRKPPQLLSRAIPKDRPPRLELCVPALFYLAHVRSAAASAWGARGGGSPGSSAPRG